MIHHLIFHILAASITLASLLVVLSTNAVKSALFLVLDLFLLAALYASMDAHFVAAIQILVYAGAITVLFVFVIMLLNLKPEKHKTFAFSPVEGASIVLMAVGFLIAGALIFRGEIPALGSSQLTSVEIERLGGNTQVVAMRLMTKFIWPFEIASFLILLAIVASIVIAKKDNVKKVGKV